MARLVKWPWVRRSRLDASELLVNLLRAENQRLIIARNDLITEAQEIEAENRVLRLRASALEGELAKACRHDPKTGRFMRKGS